MLVLIRFHKACLICFHVHKLLQRLKIAIAIIYYKPYSLNHGASIYTKHIGFENVKYILFFSVNFWFVFRCFFYNKNIYGVGLLRFYDLYVKFWIIYTLSNKIVIIPINNMQFKLYVFIATFIFNLFVSILVTIFLAEHVLCFI